MADTIQFVRYSLIAPRSNVGNSRRHFLAAAGFNAIKGRAQPSTGTHWEPRAYDQFVRVFTQQHFQRGLATAAVAIVSSYFRSDIVAAVPSLAILTVVVASRLFGEAMLVLRHIHVIYTPLVDTSGILESRLAAARKLPLRSRRRAA